MVGLHGIGKSQIVTAFAKENGYHCEILQLPLLEEGDLIGIPVISERNGVKVTEWAKPVWLQRIDEATEKGIPSILFLDELGRASAGIRQVALQLVLENRLQEHSLGEVNGLPTIKVVADNPSDEYDTAEFDAALESRFMSFDVTASIEDFLKYASGVEMLPVVTDYLAEFHEKLHFQPETDGDKGSDPRSWEALSDILKVTKNDKLIYSLIVSKIGKTVGASFHHFYNNYVKVVKPEDIMKIIGDSNITTEKEQRAMAKKLGKLTKTIEVISAQELANKMVKINKKTPKKVSAEAVLVYIASLNLESAAGILKSWKNSSDKEQTEYYYGSVQTAQDKRWFSKELISNVKS
ncbi:MAG: AAA family ATPase [Clostridiales bacterium]|nr:AAA family ATPase [Clostridiales bacterium]